MAGGEIRAASSLMPAPRYLNIADSSKIARPKWDTAELHHYSYQEYQNEKTGRKALALDKLTLRTLSGGDLRNAAGGTTTETSTETTDNCTIANCTASVGCNQTTNCSFGWTACEIPER